MVLRCLWCSAVLALVCACGGGAGAGGMSGGTRERRLVGGRRDALRLR